MKGGNLSNDKNITNSNSNSISNSDLNNIAFNYKDNFTICTNINKNINYFYNIF
jgi:hypothetical protein